MTIETPVQVLDSMDEVFILGNDWLKRMNAVLDWKQGKLSVTGKTTTVTVPVICTKRKPIGIGSAESEESTASETETESDSDFEDEEGTQMVPVYFSDSFSDTDLEYNPWLKHEVPKHADKKMDETAEISDENPAVYLAQVAPEVKEEPKLHLGPLDVHQQEIFKRIMDENADICAKSQTEIGRTNIIKHKIITGEAIPIAQAPYQVNMRNREFLKTEIQKMEENGIIQKSSSPWASPVVIVDKKDGDRRICIDYRRLNKLTKADSYPLPRIDDLLESFGQAKWFTTLDLASGYWQVAMHGPDIEKTAFIIPFGLYEFLVMPFGLSYASGTFQRLMNRVLQEYLGQFVAVYLDDVIIYTKGSYEQHIDHLRQVFESLRQANLKIKMKKCFFCFPNLHFLGHVVGRDGIKPDPDKIEKVKNYPEPTNLTELRSALGLFSYYRKFIRDFSKIARPMLNLLKKDAPYE
jgi:hypothetical protein